MKITKAKLKDLVKYYTRKIVWSDEDETYIVRVPEIQGCVTHGDTIEEASRYADEAILGSLEAFLKMKESIPLPKAYLERDSVKVPKSFPLRLEKTLYLKVKERADDEEVSMNEFISETLEQSLFKTS